MALGKYCAQLAVLLVTEQGWSHRYDAGLRSAYCPAVYANNISSKRYFCGYERREKNRVPAASKMSSGKNRRLFDRRCHIGLILPTNSHLEPIICSNHSVFSLI